MRTPKKDAAALELNSGYASAHQWLGMVLGLTRRPEDALATMKIAQQLDPFSASINTAAVWPLYWLSQWDEAIEGFRAAANLHPGYWVASHENRLFCGEAALTEKKK